MAAFFRGHIRQRFDVFREARPPITQAGVQEIRADPGVVAHPAGDFFDIRAQRLADIGDLIDERDLGREEGIGSVFDHLCRAQIGDDDRGAQGQMQLGNFFGSLCIQRAEDRAVRVHKIADRRAFPQKFRAGDHPEGDGLRLAVPDDIRRPNRRCRPARWIC